MTRLAVVGAGLIGRVHMAAIRQQAELRLSTVVDPSPQARALAAEWGVPWHETLDALLRDDRPDGVVLATPNALHVPQALTCVAAGVPCLVEKPVAADVAEGERLWQAVRDSGVPVLVGHHRAHSPIMARACAVVASGALGRLVGVMGSAVFYKPDAYFAEGPWRTQPGGGPVLINMVHEVHNLRMLCGEVVSVQAMASNAVRGLAVEDTVALVLRFASGALGTFLLSDTAACARSWEQTARENPSYAASDDEDCYVLTGTRGSLSVPTLRLSTCADTQAPSWCVPLERRTLALERDDPIRLQMAHFAQVVQGRASPLVTVQDGLRNVQVVAAILEAARSGCAVVLPA